MSANTNADFIQLWIVGLCVAMTLAGLSLGAIVAFVWKRRQERPDPLRQGKVEERLSHLADSVPLRSGKPI
jgi:hypothetical protein